MTLQPNIPHTNDKPVPNREAPQPVPSGPLMRSWAAAPPPSQPLAFACPVHAPNPRHPTHREAAPSNTTRPHYVSPRLPTPEDQATHAMTGAHTGEQPRQPCAPQPAPPAPPAAPALQRGGAGPQAALANRRGLQQGAAARQVRPQDRMQPHTAPPTPKTNNAATGEQRPAALGRPARASHALTPGRQACQTPS